MEATCSLLGVDRSTFPFSFNKMDDVDENEKFLSTSKMRKWESMHP